ncbi:MAG TPA: arginase family protein, partial [Paracoccus sp. (in: a-proteobacteria)]|nr:arginase family protein [Paracoccus sp. (in: a-proteobacteria)]
MSRISLIGAPVDSGQRNLGCLMGPDAYRVAGIERQLADLGHEVRDLGNLVAGVLPHASCDNPAVDQLDETLGWTKVLRHRVSEVLAGGR